MMADIFRIELLTIEIRYHGLFRQYQREQHRKA